VALRSAIKVVARPLKPVLRPVANRIVNRTAASLAPRFETLEATVQDVRSDLDRGIADIDGLIGPVLNAIRSQNAQSRHAQRNMSELTRTTLERLQFVRNELLYEYRYGQQHPRASEALGGGSVEPKVLNEEKIVAAKGEIRLEVGCGHLPNPDRINVDLRELDGVDIVADARNIPFERGSVAEISSAHFLEHFPTEELRRDLLPYWIDLLRPGGRLVVVVPDSQTMIDEFGAGRLSFEELREVTFGGQEYAGDFHFTMFTPGSLTELLEGAGFDEITVVETGRRNGAAYEMRLEALRPGAIPA
jgi:hypothetical protein